MTKFEVRIRCTVCNHRYKRVMQAVDADALEYVENPPCPRCYLPERVRGMDVAGGKAPAVGGSLAARAVDATAEIVMQDYQMTDLRSDVREGESAAPKLPPKQQEAADNFFGGGLKRRSAGGIMGLPADRKSTV